MESDDKFAQRIESGQEAWGLPCMAAVVVQGGSTRLRVIKGRATLGAGAPLRSDTLFRAASLTKGLTSIGALELVDSGDLRWDDRIMDVVAGLSGNDSSVSPGLQVRHVLTHSSGYAPDSPVAAAWLNPPERMELLRHTHHVAEPGDSFNYLDLNYVIIGEALAAASGMSYVDFMRSEVFRSIGLRDATFSDDVLTSTKSRATGFGIASDSLTPMPDELHFHSLAASGVWLSTHDAEQLLYYLLQKKGTVDRNAREFATARGRIDTAVFRALLHPFVDDVSHCYGWWHERFGDSEVLYHAGRSLGMQIMLGFCPTGNWGYALLTNGSTETPGCHPFLSAVRRAIYSRIVLRSDVGIEKYAAELRERLGKLALVRSLTSTPSVQVDSHQDPKLISFSSKTYGGVELEFVNGFWHLRFRDDYLSTRKLVPTGVDRYRICHADDRVQRFDPGHRPQGAFLRNDDGILIAIELFGRRYLRDRMN